MVYCYATPRKDDRLLVWNPCLGETRWIPLKADNKKYSRFALGYENNKSCRSYKLLRCWGCHNYKGADQNRVVGFEIYEFSSDSWRVLDDIDYDRFLPLYGVSLKGNTHWLAYDEKEKHDLILLSFDFTAERLKRLCLPLLENFSDFRAISVVGEEQLSLLSLSFNSRSKMEIWLTNIIDTDDIEAVLKWTKSFTVDVPFLRDYFSYGMTFSVDMEKKVVVFCSQRSNNPIIIVGEDDKYYRKFPIGESYIYRVSFWKYVINYVPSLVQIQ